MPLQELKPRGRKRKAGGSSGCGSPHESGSEGAEREEEEEEEEKEQQADEDEEETSDSDEGGSGRGRGGGNDAYIPQVGAAAHGCCWSWCLCCLRACVPLAALLVAAVDALCDVQLVHILWLWHRNCSCCMEGPD